MADRVPQRRDVLPLIEEHGEGLTNRGVWIGAHDDGLLFAIQPDRPRRPSHETGANCSVRDTLNAACKA